jgi:hypothetical protein
VKRSSSPNWKKKLAFEAAMALTGSSGANCLRKCSRSSPAGTPLAEPYRYQSGKRGAPAMSAKARGRASAPETSAPNIAP